MHNFDEISNRLGTDSKKYEKYAPDVIPMWIADTDFKCPAPVVEALVARAQTGIFGYTPVSERMKAAVVKWMRERFGHAIEPDQVEYIPVVVSGVIMAMRALGKQGDKVLVQTPSYPPFADGIKHNGRVMVKNRMKLVDGRYEIDFEDFEQKCKDPEVKLFVLCNPQNPTGRCFTREELTRMGRICIDNGVFIVSDEIHMDVVYQPHRHITFGSISQEFALNSVTLTSPSKTFNVPGLRTAVLICQNKEIKDKLHEVAVANKAVGENIFGTIAFSVCYEQCGYYADQVVDYLAQNKAAVKQALDGISGMNYLENEATYLLWIDCRGLGLDQEALMDKFVGQAKVGVQSGLEFGEEGRGFVRMNIGCPRATLDEALARIKRAFA